MLKGVLLDVGHTIAYPPSGNWFVPPCFVSLLRDYHIESPRPDVLFDAVGKGLEYLDANHRVQTEDAELFQFQRFYGVVLETLGVQRVPDELIRELARVQVRTDDNFALYEDVKDGLRNIKGLGLVQGILSDNWPSLRRRLETLGIAGYLKTVTISAEVECCKPNEPIYRAAIGGLGLEYPEVLFVDDGEENLIAGGRLGLRCLRIQRSGVEGPSQFPRATSMPDIVNFIKQLLTRTAEGY